MKKLASQRGKDSAYFIMCYFPYVYTVIQSDCQIDGYKYTGYGICVKNMSTGESRSFSDISVSRKDIEELSDRCNRLQLDPIHIEDVIDDFLCAV